MFSYLYRSDPVGQIVYEGIFFILNLSWHCTPVVLCLFVRFICQYLQYEVDKKIKETREFIQNTTGTSEKCLFMEYLQFIKYTTKIAHKFKVIVPLIIVLVFSMTIVAFFVSRENSIFKRSQRLTESFIPSVFVWILLAISYLIIATILMTQSIYKLNSKIDRFSDKVLGDVDVHEFVNASNQSESVKEILVNISYISGSKMRVRVYLFGDLTSGLFHSILIVGMSSLILFITEMPSLVVESPVFNNTSKLFCS